jgi:hypothetical protein
VSRRNSPSFVEKPGFSAGIGSRVGRSCLISDGDFVTDAQGGKIIEVRKSDLAANHSQLHHASAMLGDGANRHLFWMYDGTRGKRLPTKRGCIRIPRLSSTMSDVEIASRTMA